MNTKREYAIIWFEGDNPYALVNSQGETVVLSESVALRDAAGVLSTEQDIENAEDDLRYAIDIELLEEFFGWVSRP